MKVIGPTSLFLKHNLKNSSSILNLNHTTFFKQFKFLLYPEDIFCDIWLNHYFVICSVGSEWGSSKIETSWFFFFLIFLVLILLLIIHDSPFCSWMPKDFQFGCTHSCFRCWSVFTEKGINLIHLNSFLKILRRDLCAVDWPGTDTCFFALPNCTIHSGYPFFTTICAIKQCANSYYLTCI